MLQWILLAFVKLTGALPALLYLRPKRFYEDRAAQGAGIHGAAILLSNHKSLMDFVLYLLIFPWRTLHFLVAEVLFNKGPVFAWFLRRLGCIRVDRDAYSFGFIAEATEVLERGGVVGIFPESKLPTQKGLGAFKPSAVVIALESGAPVIPVYTDGQYGFGKRARVMIGAPIRLQELCGQTPPSRETIDRLNTLLRDKIEALGALLDAEKE
jgi:1-acyl-sn-glycerol-3-phosphate acyltransferase